MHCPETDKVLDRVIPTERRSVLGLSPLVAIQPAYAMQKLFLQASRFSLSKERMKEL